jgi:hypothetical protein
LELEQAWWVEWGWALVRRRKRCWLREGRK